MCYLTTGTGTCTCSLGVLRGKKEIIQLFMHHGQNMHSTCLFSFYKIVCQRLCKSCYKISTNNWSIKIVQFFSMNLQSNLLFFL